MHVTIKSLSLFSLAVLTAGVVSAQGAAELLPRAAADLAPAALAAPSVPGTLANTATEPVRFSRALAADEAIDLAPAAFTSRSREYWLEATAEQLERGVALDTTAPSALVRINPIVLPEGARLEIDPRLLVLERGETAFRSGSGMELLVGAAELDAAGSPFAEGTAAFRIHRDLGAGRVVLRSEGLGTPAGTRFLINVFEPKSPVELALGASRALYLHGDTLTIETTLSAGGRNLTLDAISGFVTSPAGRAWPVSFAPIGGGVYRASLALDADEPFAPGLWEVQTAVRARFGELAVARGARTAFACALPTARLDGQVTIKPGRTDAGVQVPASVRLGIEVAAAGRYEVSGLLYGTDAAGQLRPMAAAQAAAWLEPGSRTLELTLERGAVAGSPLKAPFELRGLRLADQSRMGVLHQQAVAVVIP